MILASDLNIYLTQGILIIIPFVLGIFVVITIYTFWQRFKPHNGEDVLFDHITTCPTCGVETAVGGLYCENCGTKIIAGTRVLEGRECKRYSALNPSNTVFCRFCGSSMEKPKWELNSKNHGFIRHRAHWIARFPCYEYITAIDDK